MDTTEKVCKICMKVHLCDGALVLVDFPGKEHQTEYLCPDCRNHKSPYKFYDYLENMANKERNSYSPCSKNLKLL
jgi:hypothetical protein